MRLPMLPLIILFAITPLAAQSKKAAPAKEAEAKEPKINWDGEWALVPEDSDKLEPLIEEHLKDENFAMKALWKKRLRNACLVPSALDLLFGADGLSATFGKERPAECAPDGTAGTWKRNDGETFQVTLKREGSRLIQTFQGDGYVLTHAYSMRKSGNTLALQITYAHPKLAPFSYKLVYKRAD